MTVKRHRRKLANREEKIYTYVVSRDGSRRESLSAHQSSDSLQIYRGKEFRRIVAALQANSSLLVVGEAGCGKTFLAQAIAAELTTMNFQIAVTKPGTVKQILSEIAEQLGVDTENLDGKALSIMGLMKEIADWLLVNTAFLICDNAHRFPVSLRCWLDQLHTQGQPILLLATYPPARDIFLKLPRIELEPMKDSATRAIMLEAAAELNLELTPAQLSSLQQRVGGNPMLAKRVVREEYLGLDGKALDHTQWIDGTPYLIAALMCFVIIRFIGLGFNNTSLYLLGGIITVAIGIIRILLYSLPRKSSRLGQ
jgi:energy-coupling factor transporter ATP-binding protein EcfA2